ncbi:Predicted N-acetyltransferase YhbS [Nitrosospira multiformis]|uniref:Predicted N-acetyltransferase YhbS n=1 Tax=Nitrosospira multiformis TaxID=1231 RepID=A0A1H8P899_9PROT|nr:GNAT family N-acetyltransferase [Nitrosospira multiformis]SEO38170.1 Predicted N-acetyltransferase YhbS [Nitrosospira multiformis]
MQFRIREGRLADAEAAGMICYEAFRTISQQHGFEPDFPSFEVARDLLLALLSRPDVYSAMAESEGRIIGSNFLWQDSAIAGIGPLTVTPEAQSGRVGRGLMEDVLEHARNKHFAGVRLVQAAYNNRSLSLYAKLGFEVREPLATLQGAPLQIDISGYNVRPAGAEDANACDSLCRKIHGHDRGQELRHAIAQQTAMVVEYGGRITGYATLIGFMGHAVGESNEELKALIGAADAFVGPGFLLPTRNSELFRWCLQQGLRVVQPMNLMSLGLYNRPSGFFLPSILF